MTTKKVLRLNGKILKDSKEYLTLVKKLINIQRAILELDTELTQVQAEWLATSQPLVSGAMPIAQEVSNVTSKLKALPSSAPAHKRRKIADELDSMLMAEASNMYEIFRTILASTELFDEIKDIQDEAKGLVDPSVGVKDDE